MTPGLRRYARGFTLLELLVVVAIIALASAVAAMALPDPSTTRLEREATRLAAILEAARVQARSLGAPVQWVPGPPPGAPADTPGQDTAVTDFHFTGLPEGHGLPEHWADAELTGRISVVLPGRQTGVLLGPEPVVPPQQITLQLDDKRVSLATDGLSPFAPTLDEPPHQ